MGEGPADRLCRRVKICRFRGCRNAGRLCRQARLRRSEDSHKTPHCSAAMPTSLVQSHAWRTLLENRVFPRAVIVPNLPMMRVATFVPRPIPPQAACPESRLVACALHHVRITRRQSARGGTAGPHVVGGPGRARTRTGRLPASGREHPRAATGIHSARRTVDGCPPFDRESAWPRCGAAQHRLGSAWYRRAAARHRRPRGIDHAGQSCAIGRPTPSSPESGADRPRVGTEQRAAVVLAFFAHRLDVSLLPGGREGAAVGHRLAYGSLAGPVPR